MNMEPASPNKSPAADALAATEQPKRLEELLPEFIGTELALGHRAELSPDKDPGLVYSSQKLSMPSEDTPRLRRQGYTQALYFLFRRRPPQEN